MLDIRALKVPTVPTVPTHELLHHIDLAASQRVPLRRTALQRRILLQQKLLDQIHELAPLHERALVDQVTDAGRATQSAIIRYNPL